MSFNDYDCIYELVHHNRPTKVYQSEKELLQHHEMTGRCTSQAVRPELYGQPRLSGWVGGMYGGTRNGKTVIRYESREEYLSYD